MALPSLSLYVHLPWCVKKCPYCDFNSHGLKGALPESTYVDALLKDLDQDLPRTGGREVQTVFFGGGTPSLFSAENIGRFLAGVRARMPVAAGAEVTLEANPGTVEHGRFAAYREAGVTRLSIGVQSFDPKKLEVLGRIHSSEEAGRAVEEAHAAGLHNFNLDLMYGLPRQTLEEAEADIRQAMTLMPAHISHYQLTLEPNTLFHAHPPVLPDEETIWSMQQRCQELLAAHGYGQYEVSAYAQPGRQARHNLNYWRFGDYLGIGAGAHGKLTDASGAVTRLWKLKHPDAYLESAGTPKSLGGVSQLSEGDLAFEFMLNRLRLTSPFSAGEFESATGLPLGRVQPGLDRAVELGLLDAVPEGWRVTSRGQNYLNDLQSLFLLAEDAGRKVRA
ncbi:MAG TPA: radical SAM family heme chaperone HemW [Gammaproteobacteria bacterium]|jgi:oxygen-independent coproporphyrinogen-3 oxidase|nr:radical SAM family heme chaperone HemW [Gammaproteobacteria bacterium]